MWFTLIQIGIIVTGFIIAHYTAPDPIPSKFLTALDNAPQIMDGSPLPLIYGRVRVKNMILAWYGNFSALAFGQPPAYDAFNYTLDMLFDLGVPMNSGNSSGQVINRMHGIYLGDKFHAVNVIDGGSVSVQDPLSGTTTDYFGALVEFFPGSATQNISTRVGPGAGTNRFYADTPIKAATYQMIKNSGVNTAFISSYRNHMVVGVLAGTWSPAMATEPSIVQNGITTFGTGGAIGLNNILSTAPNTAFTTDNAGIGSNGQIPPINFEVSSGCEKINNVTGKDANPVWVIRDLLTGTIGGKLGINPAIIDATTFNAAVATLNTEGHGYSRYITQKSQIKDVIGEILAQIAGTMYIDQTTGKFKIKLIRNDYVFANLPSFDSTNVSKIVGYSLSSWRDTFNQVRVSFTNRLKNYDVDSIPSQNMANAVGQDGRLRTKDLSYPGICDAATARAVANRDCATVSQPLAKFQMYCDRSALSLNPGDAFKLKWDDYGFDYSVFRVQNLNFGQLHAGIVIVDVLQDAFSDLDVNGGFITPPLTFGVQPEPLTKRVFTEAPRFLAGICKQLGLISDENVPRVFAVSAADAYAGDVREDTRYFNAINPVPFTKDVNNLNFFRMTGTLAANYNREYEPYDTTQGIQFSNVAGDRSQLQYMLSTHYSVLGFDFNAGYGLFLLGPNNLGQYEFIAAEYASDLGSNIFRLNNVWRGMWDTPAVAHQAGERIYEIIPQMVGGKGWGGSMVGKGVIGRAWPMMGYFAIGNNEFASDTITISARTQLPYPVQGFGLGGYSMSGTQGIPAVAGQFLIVTSMEEGFDIYSVQRDRLKTTVSKGNDAAEIPGDTGITYTVNTQKAGQSTFAIATGLAGPVNGNQGWTLGVSGHGAIDVRLDASRISGSGTGDAFGFRAGLTIQNWDSPRIRVNAPRWRNQLMNVRFDYGGLTSGMGFGWSALAGTPSMTSGANGIDRSVGKYVIATTTVSPTSIRQIVDISGYLPRGMQALASMYYRNLSADTNDTESINIDSLTSTNVSLGQSTTTGPVAGSTTTWNRMSVTINSLAATTAKIAVSGNLLEVATLGTVNPDGAVTEFELMVGQFKYDQLANGSFEGAFASWTTDTGGWVTTNTIASPSPTYAQGGAFASSTAHQDYSIPAGWEVGTSVVMKMWRAQTLASDTGKVTLSILDVSLAVLATVDTTLENMASLNVWYPRRLTVDMPAAGTAVWVRVALQATRTLGAGNSGACFDDHVVTLHKDLDSQTIYPYDFSVMPTQPIPNNQGQFHLAYPQIGASKMYADAMTFSPVAGTLDGRADMEWADALVHTNGKFVAPFGSNIWSAECFTFLRAGAGVAVDLRASGPAQGYLGAFTSADSFSFIVIFRVDEPGFAAQCGLAGRMEATGWSLDIAASGALKATMIGDGGTKTVTRTVGTVVEGAPHMAAIIYDAVAHTVRIQDERGSDFVSTVGFGEIASTVASLRLGRSGTGSQTLPGQIARAYMIKSALGSPSIAALFTMLKDPTGKIATYSRNNSVLYPGAADSAGATLLQAAVDQVAIGYHSGLAANGGTGLGLAQHGAWTNLIPSFDLTNATNWVYDSGTTVVQGVTDPRGLLRAVRITNADATHGIAVTPLTLAGAPATTSDVIWVRWISGNANLDCVLMDSNSVVKSTVTVALVTDGLWHKYEISFGGWTGSTATGKVVYHIQAAGVFEFCPFTFFSQGPVGFPAVYPAGALGSVNILTVGMGDSGPVQFNSEGEIIWEGVLVNQLPINTISLIEVQNGANNKNRRELVMAATGVPTLNHYDGAGTNVASNGTAIADSRVLSKIRGRWSRAIMLDVSPNAAGVFITGGTPSSAYGRAAAWANDLTINTKINLSAGAGGTVGCDGFVRKFTVQAREEKLA